MAYMSAEKVKEIRQKIKKEFPEYKFSVTRYHWFGVYVQILEGPADFYEDFQYKENVGSKENFNLQINEHHIDSNFEGVSRDVLSRIKEIIETSEKYYDRNAGDIGADYCDYTFYYTIEIGRYDKPYVVKKVAKKG